MEAQTGKKTIINNCETIMDHCEICLENNGDTFCHINSSEWIENNVQQVIGTHLNWLYLSYHNAHQQWICQQCWQELSTFHKFYERVEQSHKLIPSLATGNIKCEQIFIGPDNGNEMTVVKQELGETDNETSENELSWSSLPVSVQIGEFNIVDIKAEPELMQYSDGEMITPLIDQNEHSYNNTDNPAQHKKQTKMVKCRYCKALFTQTANLTRHINRMHTNFNPNELMCPVCGKLSPTIESHRSHVKYHKMPSKHACHMCDKAFKYAVQLKEHISTHTGEALYTCMYCPKTFKSSSNMYKHIRNNHFKEWEENHAKKAKRKLQNGENKVTVKKEKTNTFNLTKINKNIIE